MSFLFATRKARAANLRECVSVHGAETAACKVKIPGINEEKDDNEYLCYKP